MHGKKLSPLVTPMQQSNNEGRSFKKVKEVKIWQTIKIIVS